MRTLKRNEAFQGTCVVGAPYRVDLAGGTLDIWPIYPSYPGCFTINCALPYYQWIEWKPSEEWVYRFAHSKRIWKPDKKPGKAFRFIATLHESFRDQFNSAYDVTITSDLPRGSGLGGSSALAVSYVTGASLLAGKTYSKRNIVLHARYIETRFLKTTTGTQDYLSAVYGGLNAWFWTENFWKRVSLQRYKRWVIRHLILVFIGEPHISALPNWQVIRKFVEGERSVRKHLGTIAKASQQVLNGIRTSDTKMVATGLQREMEARASLDDSILSEKILAVVRTKRKGVLAWKVCGAGGGGSVLLWVQPDRKADIELKLENEGWKVIHIGEASGLPLHATFLPTVPSESGPPH